MISARKMSLCRYGAAYPWNKLHCCTFTTTYWHLL